MYVIYQFDQPMSNLVLGGFVPPVANNEGIAEIILSLETICFVNMYSGHGDQWWNLAPKLSVITLLARQYPGSASWAFIFTANSMFSAERIKCHKDQFNGLRCLAVGKWTWCSLNKFTRQEAMFLAIFWSENQTVRYQMHVYADYPS